MKYSMIRVLMSLDSYVRSPVANGAVGVILLRQHLDAFRLGIEDVAVHLPPRSVAHLWF